MKATLAKIKKAVTGDAAEKPARGEFTYDERGFIQGRFVSKTPEPLRKRRPRYLDAPTVAFPIVCAGRERELIRPNEIADLRRIQAQNDEIRAQLDKCGHRAARDQIRAVRSAYQDAPSAEAFAKMQTPTLDVDDLERHFAGIRRNVKIALRENNATALASLTPIFERALAMVDAEISKVRTVEDDFAARYQLDPAPGNVAKALHNLAYQIEEGFAITLGGTVSTPPRSILAGLGLAKLLDE